MIKSSINIIDKVEGDRIYISDSIIVTKNFIQYFGFDQIFEPLTVLEFKRMMNDFIKHNSDTKYNWIKSFVKTADSVLIKLNDINDSKKLSFEEGGKF